MNKKDIFLDYKSLIKSSLIDVIKHALKKNFRIWYFKWAPLLYNF